MLKVGQQQKKGLSLWFIEPSLWISIAALHYDSIDTAALDLLAKLNFNVITNLIIDAIFEVKKCFPCLFLVDIEFPYKQTFARSVGGSFIFAKPLFYLIHRAVSK